MLTIENETEACFAETEVLFRDAFWNLYREGCDEHVVARLIRESDDYLPQYSLVARNDGKIVGCILYTKSRVEYNDSVVPTATFGPVAVAPDCQGKGIGSRLISESIQRIMNDGIYKAVAIFGYPHVYRKHGFVPSKNFGISSDGLFPQGLQIIETEQNILPTGGRLVISDLFSQVVDVDAFDKSFPPKEKFKIPSQQVFAYAVGLKQDDPGLTPQQIKDSMNNRDRLLEEEPSSSSSG